MGKGIPRVCSEQFNPYQSMTISIPLPVLRYKGRPDQRSGGWRRLPHGAKLLYGRLMLFRGRNREGFCAPDLNRLSVEMGETVDTVNRWLMELVAHGFIKRKRRGPGRSAECAFLPHPVFNSDSEFLPNQATLDSGKMPNQGRPLTPDFSLSDSEEMPDVDSGKMPNAYKEEKESGLKRNHEKESSSSVASLAEKNVVEGATDPNDDDDRNSFPHEQRPFSAAFVERGRLALQFARVLKAVDYYRVLLILRSGWTEQPIDTTRVRLIDLDGMKQILSNFEMAADFAEWLADCIKRRLGDKAEAPGYGLWIKDATTRGPDIAAERRQREKQAADARIADERQRAEAVAVLTNPQPAEAAIDTAERLLCGDRSLPFLVREVVAKYSISRSVLTYAVASRIRRLGAAVSPEEVIRQNEQFKHCDACEDKGVCGTSLDRTLRFCACASGEEWSINDPGLPERKIGRVYASLRSVLQEAAEVLGCGFKAVSIENCFDVCDDGTAVTFKTESRIDAENLREPETSAILERVGLQGRAVKVIHIRQMERARGRDGRTDGEGQWHRRGSNAVRGLDKDPAPKIADPRRVVGGGDPHGLSSSERVHLAV